MFSTGMPVGVLPSGMCINEATIMIKHILSYGAVLVMLGGVAQAQAPFAGVFSDGRITLTLQQGNAGYTGQVQFDGQTFTIAAREAGGTTLQGTYTYNGQPIPFQAMRQGDRITIISEGERYTLTRRAAASTTTARTAEAGVFSDPAWGLQFTPPAGWQGERDGEMYVFASAGRSGVLVFVPHETTSLAQLRAEFEAGVNEGTTHLQVTGPITAFGDNGVAADVSGTLEGQPSRTRVVGLLSPYGRGVTIMGAMPAEAYTEDFGRLVEDVARSVVFSPVQTAAAGGQATSDVQEWTEWFQGCRLSYFSRYNSGYDGTGYVDESVIDLCPGYFRYGDESGSNFGPGSMASVKKGAGEWQVTQQGRDLVLVLRFNDGSVHSYTLGYEDGKTYLNGRRWLRTCNPNDQVVEARPQCY